MITCKQDLINTYIYDDGGELRDVYFSIAEKFGFLIDEGDYNLGIISVMKDCKYVQDINSVELVRKCKKLTLSDLKPRTKIEYEMVSINDVDESMLDIVFIDPNGDVSIRNASVSEFFCCQLYRKVERPLEWFDDAVDYINSLDGEATDVDRNGGVKKLYINAEMDEREVKDFARIVLGQ